MIRVVNVVSKASIVSKMSMSDEYGKYSEVNDEFCVVSIEQVCILSDQSSTTNADITSKLK